MRLLKITETEYPRLEGLFEEVEQVSIEKVSPEVVDGKTNVMIDGNPVEKYDAAFLQIPSKNPVFGRVLLETLEEKGVRTNYTSIGFFIMAKKNYLSYVLNEKAVETPDTAIIASPKAARNLDRELDFPIIARRYEDMQLTETKKLDNKDEVEEFVEGIEYGEDLLILQKYNEGDKYKALYTNGQIISLKDKTEGWRIKDDNLHYSSLGKKLEERVEKTMKAIGTPFGEVHLQGGKVVDVEPNPDLETYTDISGKNAFEPTAEILKQE